MSSQTEFVREYSHPTIYVILAILFAVWLWLKLLYVVIRLIFAPRDDPNAWLECLSRSPHRNLILPPTCISSSAKSGNRAIRLAQGVKQVVARRFRSKDPREVLVPSALPATCTPLLCFVNKKSGGNQGIETLSSLRLLLNPSQIFDVHACDSVDVLRTFSVLPRLRVLVAGGDGTVAAIINSSLHLDSDKRPPIAILPLGTGNDLARTLGWGGTADTDNLAAFLLDVCHAKPEVRTYLKLRFHIQILPHSFVNPDLSPQKLDRWKFSAYRDSGAPSSDASKPLFKEKVFMNYFGVGVDAMIAMKFDSARKSRSCAHRTTLAINLSFVTPVQSRKIR
jgi:hypothetical protein